MGNYITQSDLEIPVDALIELTDDNNTGQVDTSVVNRAISDAEAEFDGYVGGRYKVPLTSGLPVAARCCRVIAKHYLYQRRDTLPDNLKAEYDNVIRFLRDIAKGVASLGVDPAPTEESSQGVEIEASDRVFGRDKLSGM